MAIKVLSVVVRRSGKLDVLPYLLGARGPVIDPDLAASFAGWSELLDSEWWLGAQRWHVQAEKRIVITGKAQRGRVN